MDKFVIDASVVLKWYLPDEYNTMDALSILDRYITGEISVLAPYLLEYELINGLIIAQRRGRIDKEVVVKSVEGFEKLGVEMKSISMIGARVIHYVEKYKISAYDASYIALAEKEAGKLITADEPLYKKIKELKFVKYL